MPTAQAPARTVTIEGKTMTRERLPDTRRSVTHRVVIGSGESQVKLFITISFYEDGRPGEVFLQVDEKGTTLSGFCICMGVTISLCLQNGVPLSKLHEKLSYQDFEPQGITDDEEIHFAHSVIDYAVRWMQKEYGNTNAQANNMAETANA
jgi:hypothetical protein